MPLDHQTLLTKLRALHDTLRDDLRRHMEITALDEMARATEVRGGDTIYALDARSEEIILPFCDDWGAQTPFLLVMEGLHDADSIVGEGRRLFGCEQISDAQFILICDPIDGTRPLMYDKRSAWMLTGIAPNLGDQTTLQDIEVAMQTELPTRKAGRGDSVWAIRGRGAWAHQENFATGEIRAFTPTPSGAQSVEGGFAMLSKFFIGSKGWLAELEEELMREVLGPPPGGQPQTFDDQYICNGGQLYELMTGRDRFNGDLRPLAHKYLHGAGGAYLCSHPYDLCTELIAREVGVIITDEHGQPLRAPLNVTFPMTWLAYANADIQREIEPVLLPLIERRTAR